MPRRNKRDHPQEGIRGKKYNTDAPRRTTMAYNSHGVQPENLELDSLVKNYLCLGEDSDCVRIHKCECLDACRFGQRYLELTCGLDFSKPVSRKIS